MGGSRWLDRCRRPALLLVAGHTGFCALLGLGVWAGLPYSAAVILVGPVLGAAATCEGRVYPALLPQTAAAALFAIFLRAPNRSEALVAFLGLGVTVLLLSELLFRISQDHRRTMKALRRRTEVQQALHSAVLGLLQGHNVDTLLEEILRRACALLDTPHGDLFLVEGDHLRCRVALGALRWMQETGFRMAKGRGIAGRVWETGKPLLVTDYGQWRERLPDPRLAFTRHAVGIPLVVDQQVKGVVVVARDTDPPFTPEDLALMEQLGELASLVLQNASLYRTVQEEVEQRREAEEKLRRRTELLMALQATTEELVKGLDPQRLLEAILHRACGLLNAEHGSLLLVEGDVLRGRIGIGDMRWVGEEGLVVRKGEGMTGRVWETGQPLVVEDYARWPGRLPISRLDEIHPTVAVPLKIREEVAGVFVIGRRDPGKVFTEEEIAVILRFAQVASLALQNASLFQAAQEELEQRQKAEARLEQRTRLLEALHRVTEGLLSALDPERLLEAIAQGACELLRTPHCNLFLVEGEVLRCRVALGNMGWTRTEPLQIPKGQGLAGRVWETGLPVVVEDYPHWPGRLPDPRFHGVYHSVGVPIVVQGEVAGVLNLAREDPGDPFTAEEVAVLAQFAHLASLVLHSARLRAEAETAARAVEAQRAFYEEILNNVQTDIAVFDPQLRYVYVNPSAIRDPELRQWIVGRDDHDYCRRKGRDPALAVQRQEYMRRAMEERRVLEYEETIPTPSGEERYFLRRICPILDAEGKVVRLIGYGIDITDRKRMELHLAHMALHDTLTGLANRTLFLDRLRQALERTHRTGTRVAVLFVDLDRFKLINDSLGHAAGDQLLVEASRRFQECLRSTDTLARLAGDEFVVLAEVQDPTDPARIAERLIEALRPPFLLNGEEVYMTTSIGIAVGDWTRRPEDLLREADTAMYRAKASGRNRYQYFEEAMHREAVRQLHLEGELRRAMERGEFVLHYQPVVRLRDQVPVEMEALIRWRHPRNGLQLPADFLEAAEHAGLGPALGAWVLGEACRQARRWATQIPQPPMVSVNLSASQLRDPLLPDRLLTALQTTGASPQNLRLEISERVLVSLPPEALNFLERLSSLEIGFHVDDFHNALAPDLFHRLPVRAVKVPWSAISTSPDPQQVTHRLLTGVQDLRVSVVVKGIEDPEVLVEVSAMGFEYAEGFAIARPMDPEAATAYLLGLAGR
jgi:diguanylate cyclase (GGDEF)-like protein